MKTRRFSVWSGAITLFVGLTVPLGVRLAAQEQKKEQHHYKLIDIGTFGGPQSYLNSFTRVLSNPGVVVGSADTLMSDPFPSAPFNANSFVSHAFQWHKGVLTDLGALAPGWSSAAIWISDTGLIVGISQNGVIDPLTGLPEIRAVLWKNGHIIDLGTFGGNESAAFAVNNAGQVVGFSTNSIPDPFSLAGLGTQTRAFLWQNGVVRDLGSLGGPDAAAFLVNERGQAAGVSYTSSNPGPNGVPQTDPFLWQTGKMIDLGSLGGPSGSPMALNNSGQVVGQMDPAGTYQGFPLFHPFLWDRGRLTDLGTFYPPLGFGIAFWINDSGDIAGFSDNLIYDFPFLWEDGVKTNLGDVAGDTIADALNVNSKGQIVGQSGPSGAGVITPFAHAFLWEKGGPIIDLNTLVASPSGAHVTNAFFVNEGGEIAALGLVPGGDQHAFLLIPCGEGEEGCGDNAVDATVLTQSSPAPVTKRPSTAAGANSGLSGRGMLDRLRAWRFPDRRDSRP